MRISFLISILLSFTLFAEAQTGTTISGTVQNKSRMQPVENASVLLIPVGDTVAARGVVTDKKGKFVFKDVRPGSYFLRTSFIGLAGADQPPFTLNENQESLQAGLILLDDEFKKLQEVVVSGKKGLLNASIDRKTYQVDQDIMSRSGSVSDILKNIPSVEVDIEGGVSLRGSADVLILINGKPSPLMGRSRAEVLQQLPANTIERIEVITNPSARYRTEGTSGIINIVLKKSVKLGWNGTLIANAGNKDRYNGGITLNYNPGKVNLYTSYSIRQDNRNRFGQLDREFFDSSFKTSGYYHEENMSNARPVSQILNTGIDLSIDDNNKIGVSGNFYKRRMTRHDEQNRFTYDEAGSLINNYDRLRYTPEKEDQWGLNGFYEHLFPGEEHELRVEFNTSTEKEEENNYYTNNYKLPKLNSSYDNNFIHLKNAEHQLTADYVHALTEDSKLELGFDGRLVNEDHDFLIEYMDTVSGDFIEDTDKSNQFRYKENINAIYATYQRGYEKFGYEVGLRFEQARIKSELVTLDSIVDNDYNKLYPTVHLSYKLNEKSELQLNYSKRVNRPDADELNPFPEYQDPRNLRAGNPYLLPEMIHSFEFGYKIQHSGFSFIPSVYYRNKQNGFTAVIVQLDDSTFLTTEQNLSNDHSAGLEMIFSGKSGKFFNVNLSTNIFYNQIDASNLGYSRKKSIVSGTANIILNFTPWKATMVQMSGNYRSARLTPQGEVMPTFVSNAGIRQDLFKGKLSLTLTASDIFSSLRQKSELKTPYFNQYTLNKRDSKIIYLGLSYRFGAIKKAEKEGNEKLQFDNSL